MQRPDLSHINPEIIAYINYLEEKLKIRTSDTHIKSYNAPLEKDEIPSSSLAQETTTSVNIISISSSGIAKRTFRHLYTRQHRAGMGVFDIDIDEPDYPVVLVEADTNQNLLLFTNFGKVFRYKTSQIPETGIRAHGQYIFDRISLETNERLVTVLPEQASGYVAMVSESGRVRVFRHHLFGEHMRAGSSYLNPKDMGMLAAACWTSGDGDLFILSKNGIGIRFSEKLVSPQGDVGLKLSTGDRIAAISGVKDDTKLFILSADGKGTVRLMTSFAPNKSLGGTGKQAVKSERVVGAFPIEGNDDAFAISRMCKVIRFPTSEIPETEGAIQGVNCMSLRSDEVTAVLRSNLRQ